MRIDARLLPLVLAVLFSTQLEVAGQSFVKGYYVTIDSQRFDGFIRVDAVDSRDSPWKFHYRAVSDVNAREVNVNDVRELGLNDGTVFRRLTVEMDRFPSDLDQLSIHLERWERNPTLKTETLFLRVLVKGKAFLYAYDEGTLHRYFFTVGDARVKQLISKRYFNKNMEIVVNEAYKQVLFNELKCETITQKMIVDTRYEKKDFVKLFTLYNNCAAPKP